MLATPLSRNAFEIHGSFSENSSTQIPAGALQKCQRSHSFASPPPPRFFFFISLLAGVRRAPCKSFFELEACLPGRTERAGLMRGTCSTEGGKKQQNNGARNFTRQLGGGG